MNASFSKLLLLMLVCGAAADNARQTKDFNDQLVEGLKGSAHQLGRVEMQSADRRNLRSEEHLPVSNTKALSMVLAPLPIPQPFNLPTGVPNTLSESTPTNGLSSAVSSTISKLPAVPNVPDTPDLPSEVMAVPTNKIPEVPGNAESMPTNGLSSAVSSTISKLPAVPNVPDTPDLPSEVMGVPTNKIPEVPGNIADIPRSKLPFHALSASFLEMMGQFVQRLTCTASRSGEDLTVTPLSSSTLAAPEVSMNPSITLPKEISTPQVSNIPALPAVPGIPTFSAVPNIPVPPNVSNLPATPSIPSLPDQPSLPTLQNPPKIPSDPVTYIAPFAPVDPSFIPSSTPKFV